MTRTLFGGRSVRQSRGSGSGDSARDDLLARALRRVAPGRKSIDGHGPLGPDKVEELQRALKKASVSSPASLRAVLDAMFELDGLLPDKLQLRLYNFLLHEKNLRRMIFMLTSERTDEDVPDESLSAREVNRYRYVVSIFILFGPPQGRMTIAPDEELVMPLLDFLITDRPASTVGIEYVARVIASLLHTSPHGCSRHFAEQPNFIPGLVRRVQCDAVSQLLQRMVCERAFYDEEELNFGPINEQAVRLLASCDVQRLLADTFTENAGMGIFVLETIRTLENCCATIFQLSMRGMISARYSTMIDSMKVPGAAPFGDSLEKLDLFQNVGPLGDLMQAALDGPPYVLSIVLKELSHLLTVTVKGRNSKLSVVRKVVWNVSLERAFETIAPHIPRLAERLELSRPPLGPERLEICKFFSVCFQTADDMICCLLTKHGIHKKMIALMYKMPKNSFLHPLVVSAIRGSLECSKEEVHRAWLCEVDLVGRIEAGLSSSKAKSADDAELYGTLMQLAITLSEFIISSVDREVAVSFHETMGSENWTKFSDFQRNVLKPLLAENNPGICGHPEKPVVSRGDHDFVYDEDEIEALWIYNRLLDKEMGEETEEGALSKRR